MITLNGVSVHDPKAMQWSLQDLSSESSGRTLDGLAHKDVVARKVKLSVEWPPLTWAEASAILTAVNTSVFFSVSYPDLQTGAQATKTFYAGDRKAACMIWQNGKQMVNGLAFDLIER